MQRLTEGTYLIFFFCLFASRTIRGFFIFPLDVLIMGNAMLRYPCFVICDFVTPFAVFDSFTFFLSGLIFFVVVAELEGDTGSVIA